MMNPVTLIDAYKFDHRRQYPKGMTRVLSNWTPRDSRIVGVDRVVLAGLQLFLDKYLMQEFDRGFFSKKKERVVKEYARRLNGVLGPNNIGTDHIAALHDLQYLPLHFRAVPEGSSVPLRVPMFTIENTHDDFAWLVNYIESLTSSVVWGACTSATNALRLRKLLDYAAKSTGSPMDFVQWQGHDFSFRGMFGPEAAAISGMGHLLAFTGTDTIPALDVIEEYYTPSDENYLIGGSVAATEHSAMCAGGEATEKETFERLLELYPSGIVSVVSDTWDLWNVLTVTVPSLKDKILARPGKLVIRPDSGNPADIVCGNPAAPQGSPESKGVIELLWETFGGTVSSTGHRILDSHIGCIYGDSITYDRAHEITRRLAAKGFASCNMVFGVGSFTYQYTTRDTFGFALKSTWVEVNGEGRDIFKNPKTDNGVKKSAKGRLAVLQTDNGLELVSQATPEQEAASVLESVWKDGEFVRWEPFDVIRERALKAL
jgi:nicotinamide phosphoribosyltransferase